jgi:hypothetical protein
MLFGKELLANVSVLRVLWGCAAVGVALLVRRAATPDRLLAAAGTIMLARLAFEPNVFAYYLVPAAVLAVAWSARNERPVLLRGITTLVLGAWCISHWAAAPLWWAVLAVGMTYVCGPMTRSLFLSVPLADPLDDTDPRVDHAADTGDARTTQLARQPVAHV